MQFDGSWLHFVLGASLPLSFNQMCRRCFRARHFMNVPGDIVKKKHQKNPTQLCSKERDLNKAPLSAEMVVTAHVGQK